MTAMGVSSPQRSNAFLREDVAFSAVTGSAPALVRLVDVDAHEGPTYVPDQDALFVTTVPRRTPDGTMAAQVKRIPRTARASGSITRSFWACRSCCRSPSPHS